MLNVAFKEWAVICRALAEGRQALVLRKGGISIAEGPDGFQVEHTRFWLFPTYTHQQRNGIKPEALPLLDQAEAKRPPTGTVHLQHFAEVSGIHHVRQLAPALLLSDLHLWSEATVRMQLAYRTPGLFVLPVRVYQMPAAVELPNVPYYDGCRSWVELERDLPTEGANPVLDDKTFHEILRTLDALLTPTALA